jgi:hypothetical protein
LRSMPARLLPLPTSSALLPGWMKLTGRPSPRPPIRPGISQYPDSDMMIATGRLWQILLQKSFFEVGLKFSDP